MELRRSKLISHGERKLLLMGCKGSGKSTIMKHLQMIHGHGYSEKDGLRFICHIYRYISCIIQSLIMKFNWDDLCVSAQHINYIMNFNKDEEVNEDEKFDYDLICAMKSVWNDNGVKRRCLMGEFGNYYWFRNIDRILSDQYVPNDQDILQIPNTDTNIVQQMLDIKQDRFIIINPCRKYSEWKRI